MTDAAHPLSPDQIAAHRLLSELRTRIATQPLPYRDGVEASALESLWKLFDIARAAMAENPGCQAFAALASDALNRHVRPVTARWHRAHENGQLATRDGADAFRADLLRVQGDLLELARKLHRMAYGTDDPDDFRVAQWQGGQLERLFADLPFGIGEIGPQPGPGQNPKVAVATRELINQDEAKAIRKRRRLVFDVKDDNDPRLKPLNAVGLALSGGGIRSATFSLGVVQVLADRNLLHDVDFLSTVSGGGYTGSFLAVTLDRSDAAAPAASVGGAKGPDPEPIQYLRQHAKYLSVDHLGRLWTMAAGALAGLLLNWTGPLFVVCLGAWLAALVEHNAATLRAALDTGLPWLAAVFAAALILFGFAMRWMHGAASPFGRLFRWVLSALLGALLAEGLFVAHTNHFGAGFIAPLVKSVLPVGVLASAVPTLLRFLPIARSEPARGLILKVALTLAALLFPVIAIGLMHELLWLGPLGLDSLPGGAWLAAIPGLARVPAPALLLLAALAGGVAAFGLDINLTGPHRLYRNALAATFIRSKRARSTERPLDEVNDNGRAPYHLINATVNLPAETTPQLRDRKCDFFLFSKLFCGSPATGYYPTSAWKAGARTVDLATAMAISGAAVAPNMGLASFPTLRAALSLLNVRLSYWIGNPAARKWNPFPSPGFLCLLREMTGVGMTARGDWLNLSDGGHIENLGLYELLRRRCKYIICVDGEQDGAYQFPGLMTALRHAQIDLGVRVTPVLDDLRPNPKTGLSYTHFAFCRIAYPDAAGFGFVLYLKASLTGNEDELLHRFKHAHPEFPHQTTLDQFFDQETFEMYRRLGAHVANGVFGEAIIGKPSPTTVAAWFRSLAVSLLPPSAADDEASPI